MTEETKQNRLFELPENPYFKTDKRHTLDTYLTPMPLARWAVRRAWELVENNREYTQDDPLVIMEVCAGPAPFAQAADEFFTGLEVPHVTHGVEINPAFPRPACVNHWWVQDATDTLPVQADIILMNPAFSLTEQILRSAISALRLNGHVIALLASHFEFAKVRDAFLSEHFYKERIVLSRRPGFYYALLNGNERYGRSLSDGSVETQSGKGTDNMHYCIFVFDDKRRRADNRLFWDYDDEDPLHRSMQKSKSMAVYALIYEAAKAKEGDLVFDDWYSLMAARFKGWGFVDATPEQRLGMRAAVKEELERQGFGYNSLELQR